MKRLFRLLPRSIVFIVAIVLISSLAVLRAQETTPLSASGDGISSAGTNLVVEFSYRFPGEWSNVVQEGIPGGGEAIALVTDANPRVLLALSVVQADSALSALAQSRNHTYEVNGLLGEPETPRLGGAETALQYGVLPPPDTRRALMVAVQLEDGIYALGQAVGDRTALADAEAIVSGVVGSVAIVSKTDNRRLYADVPGEARLCRYLATVRIDSVTVVNAEEARGQSDFGRPGDEITLTYAVGPIDGDGAVNYGEFGDYLAQWSADLQPSQQASGVGELARYVCAPDFGVLFGIVEDDSTVFVKIETPLGAPAVVPLVRNDQILEQAGSKTQVFSGETQDGNFEYRIDYTVIYNEQPILENELTPTLTPSHTLTPSPTLSPTPTDTPSPTFTPSPTDTRTPTSTFTPSLTPTTTHTPTPTQTPTHTYTPSNTPTTNFTATANSLKTQQAAFDATVAAAELAAQQAALEATQTAFFRMQTETFAALFPSETPTPTSTYTFTPTPTDTATFTPTHTPTDTFTPKPTYTPSETPTVTYTPSRTPTATHTFTPSPTYTPSETFTPSATFTPSLTPTLTSTPTALTCAGAMPSRLYPGLHARVTPGGVDNRVRSAPSRQAAVIYMLPPGTEFDVTDGPVCRDGYIWYEVNGNGWTAEGTPGEYWLQVFENWTPTPEVCSVFAREQIRIRSLPSTSGEVVGRMENGESRLVIGRQPDASGFNWWQIGPDEWVREDTVGESNDSVCQAVPVVSRG